MSDNEIGITNLVRIVLIIGWREHNEKKTVLKYRNTEEKNSHLKMENDTGDKPDLQARMMGLLVRGQKNAPQVVKKETWLCHTLDFGHVAL